jgi:branched-chain amino acid transport system substrate-binding protein
MSCTLALDFDQKQPCSVDADCPYTAGPGSCVDGFCRPGGADDGTTTESATTSMTATTEPTATTTTDDTTSTTTVSPTDTTADTTTTDATTMGPTGCTLNSQCENDQRCGADGVCVDLLTPNCQILEWPESGEVDNVVFVGSIMPTSPPFTNLVQPLENAVQLAIEDFNQETTLQGNREIAWVGCDDSQGGSAAVDAATHLVTNVGVPAIIGPIFSESVIDVANDVAIPNGVMLMAPAATAMTIPSLDDSDLVWRTIAGDVYQSNAIIDRFLDLDDDGSVNNLLILAKDDAYGNGILTAILPELEAGLPTTQIYSATYPDPTMFASQDELLAAYGQVLAGAAVDSAAQPFYSHVLFIGTSELQAMLYAYIGTVWNPGEPEPLPFFTFSHGAVPELERFITDIGVVPGTEALNNVPTKQLIMSHLEGTTPVVLNEVNFEAFSVRYRIRFNDEEPLTSAALSYDATMSTLFAMCTVDAADPVTGAGAALGMQSLVDPGGEFISFSGVDLSFITDARNALATGRGTVDLQGVSGELEWDVATGDVRADVWGWNLLDPMGDASVPVSTPTRQYVLDPEPATDGTWCALPLSGCP